MIGESEEWADKNDLDIDFDNKEGLVLILIKGFLKGSVKKLLKGARKSKSLKRALGAREKFVTSEKESGFDLDLKTPTKIFDKKVQLKKIMIDQKRFGLNKEKALDIQKVSRRKIKSSIGLLKSFG